MRAVQVGPFRCGLAAAAGVAALRAQDIRGERYLVLDSYDEAEEPYEDAFSQDVAADLYGATQINE